MKVIIANRNVVYQIVKAAFAATNVHPLVAELGVHDGGNATVINDILTPRELFLIDAWAKEAFSDYTQNNAHRSWVDGLEKFSGYFGGPLDSQSTFDALYQRAVSRFQGKNHVHFIRAGSRLAAPILRDQLGPGRKLDLIYVDASHQYETVLDDLIEYQEFLAPNGFLQLNDCCHSAQGARQNLGVLEAAVKYCKMSDFIPAVVTNTDWTDVLLVRRDSPMLNILDKIITGSDVPFVELPHQLFGALKVRPGRKSNLSFA